MRQDELVNGADSQPPPAPSTVLSPGLWMFCYPPRSAEHLQKTDIQDLGLTGIIAHATDLSATAHCSPQYVQDLASLGLQVAIGVGFLDPPYSAHLTRGIIHAVDACTRTQHPPVAVMLDWEGAWDGHVYEASALAADVLEQAPRAPEFCIDCPWWAPLTTFQGHATHPSAPYSQFARLATHEIYVQAYGAPRDGLSLRMLEWARYKQWPRLDASYAQRVFATVQMYHRTLRDHLSLLLTETHLCLWNYPEMDAVGRYALRVRVALARVGPMGPDALLKFQARAGLKPDGIVGPKTAAALNLPPPPEERPPFA